jgi:hypothetical protein
MDELEKNWANRPPAKLTLEKFNIQDKLNRELEGKDNQFDKTICLMGKDIKDINEKLDGMTSKLDKFIESADRKYVNYDVFSPVRKLVYGAAGVILTVVITALIYLLIKDS